jgi:hypothetical protein
VRALGLDWVREGLGPSVRARGTVGGRAVEVRWRRGLSRDRVRLLHGQTSWRLVPTDDELPTLIAGPPVSGPTESGPTDSEPTESGPPA